MKLSSHQRVAIENPCVYDEQCFDPRFGAVYQGGDIMATYVLTMNVGLE